MADTVAVQPPPAMRIRWLEPGGAGPERDIRGDVTIGRGAGCDIVIDDPAISRSHARLRASPSGLVIEDLGSRNGTLVNGESVARCDLRPGDAVVLGSHSFEVIAPGTEVGTRALAAVSAEGLTVIQPTVPSSATVLMSIPDEEEPASGTVPASLLASPIVSERALAAAGISVTVSDALALGSGLGSFVFVDALRIGGMDAASITVVGSEPAPFSRYQRLCQNSQIPAHERLRSNSDSCPDNLWGFPGYAVRELWGNLKRGDLGTTLSVLWSIFGESAIADTYTPRSGDVFTNVTREAERIGWNRMLRYGRIRTIRKTEEGRILVVASEGEGPSHRQFAVASPMVHLALGYPAIQLLPDLAEYRERTADRQRVVNAYEEHAALYGQLRERGGTVILRGRGIVASRVLQRLYEERLRNPDITVIHLHRSKLRAGRRYGWSQRKVDGEFEFQAFNWPKGCWTGPQRYALEAAAPEDRKGLLDVWGGTTTANRRDWRRIVREGLRDGWYHHEYGVVEHVVQTDDGLLRVRVRNNKDSGGTFDLAADFVIDCTGLVASPDRSPVLDDVIRTYNLERNPFGRFHVTNDFEIPGMRHGTSRMYAAGALTLGGPFATVDSFLGLQYAAIRAVNALAESEPAGLHRLGPLESLGQWVRWARRQAP
ncbi:MAG: FHA domain-containing protein [Chloroflexi bacterium]|nr:FHA domain-containing protein [Chloroflexota bacterium]